VVVSVNKGVQLYMTGSPTDTNRTELWNENQHSLKRLSDLIRAWARRRGISIKILVGALYEKKKPIAVYDQIAELMKSSAGIIAVGPFRYDVEMTLALEKFLLPGLYLSPEGAEPNRSELPLLPYHNPFLSFYSGDSPQQALDTFLNERIHTD